MRVSLECLVFRWSKQGSGCGGGGGSSLLLEYFTTVRAAGQGGLTGMPESVGVHVLTHH